MTRPTRFAILLFLFLRGTFAFGQVQDDASLADRQGSSPTAAIFLLPCISSDVTLKGITQSVNPSAADFFSDLQVGFNGTYWP
jgi:hypothetical protein